MHPIRLQYEEHLSSIKTRSFIKCGHVELSTNNTFYEWNAFTFCICLLLFSRARGRPLRERPSVCKSVKHDVAHTVVTRDRSNHNKRSHAYLTMAAVMATEFPLSFGVYLTMTTCFLPILLARLNTSRRKPSCLHPLPTINTMSITLWITWRHASPGGKQHLLFTCMSMRVS